MMAACDTFRSGAVEQLKVHARCLEVDLFDKGYHKDPAAVAGEAIKQATVVRRRTEMMMMVVVVMVEIVPFIRFDKKKEGEVEVEVELPLFSPPPPPPPFFFVVHNRMAMMWS